LKSEFEVVEDVLNIRREAVQIVLEIRKKLLLAGARHQITQRKFRGVIEGLSCCVAEGGANKLRGSKVIDLAALSVRPKRRKKGAR
jgi:hypothetical protein